MCGIAGWVSYDGDLKARQDVITAMTKTMARRGPDAGGVWIDRHVGLGHRRLAIIDLAGGVQPMQVEEEGRTTISLIYTGEVYNFVELRDELRQLGHRWWLPETEQGRRRAIRLECGTAASDGLLTLAIGCAFWATDAEPDFVGFIKENGGKIQRRLQFRRTSTAT